MFQIPLPPKMPHFQLFVIRPTEEPGRFQIQSRCDPDAKIYIGVNASGQPLEHKTGDIILHFVMLRESDAGLLTKDYVSTFVTIG